MAKETEANNFLEIEIHKIDGIPPSWYSSENGQAPMYAEHPFRYDVEVLGLPKGEGTHAFSNGRLLEPIQMYRDFIDNVPRSRESKQEELDDIPSAPGAPPPPPPGSARPTTENATTASSPSLLFVLTSQCEASEVKEEQPQAQKKDAKGQKKNAPPPPPVNVEPTRPVAPEGDELPPFVVRIPLRGEVFSAFESLVEKGQCLTLQFSRRLRPNCPPEWEDLHEQRFRALIRVPLKHLSTPGSTHFNTTVRLEPIELESREEEKGKKKAPPKKSKQNIPSLLAEEPESGEKHPFFVNNTSAHISVFCNPAISRLPQTRPMPNLQPSDMIPRRVRTARRPLEASKQFAKQIASLAERIVTEYRDHARVVNLEGNEARNSFLAFLKGSGHAQAYQQLLAPIVQAVVKERFIKKAAPTRIELELIVNELYTYLLDQVHIAMDRVFGPRSNTVVSAALDGDDDARWRRLTQEAEVMRETSVAVRYFQERLGQAKDEDMLPDIWCEYAEFSLRSRDVLRAEQAFREALSLDSAHVRSLVAYGLLLVSRNRAREAEVFLQSAVDIDGSALTWGALALFWDVLRATLSDKDANAAIADVYSREGKAALAQAMSADPSVTSPEQVFEQLGRRLVDLHLEDLANVALVKANNSSFSVDLLYAKLFFQADQIDEACDILTSRLSSGTCNGVQECRARMLLGDIYATGGNLVEAEAAYDAALRIDPECASSESLVRLGNIYISLGRYKDALATFLVAAKQWPSGLTWLGVGISYYRLEDMGRAEQALNESNILNNLNPKTWAYLALLCMRQRRDEDAEGAYNQSVKLGLADPHLIAEVGTEYYRSGNLPIAEASFRRALTFTEDPNIHMHLARTLVSMKLYGAAREEFRFVAEHGVNEFQRTKASEQLELLPVEAESLVGSI